LLFLPLRREEGIGCPPSLQFRGIEVFVTIAAFVEAVKEDAQVSILPFVIAIQGGEDADEQFPHATPPVPST
jgi:hypothetical protein